MHVGDAPVAPGAADGQRIGPARVQEAKTAAEAAIAANQPGVPGANPAPVLTRTPTAPSPTPILILKPATGSLVVQIKVLKKVDLRAPKPIVSLGVTVNQTTQLTVTLLDLKGHTLAAWSTIAKQGSFRHSLLLPPDAKRPGSARLRVTAVGQKAKPITASVILLSS